MIDYIWLSFHIILFNIKFDDEVDDPDPMNRFFKQIFKNGTEEQKRAMMKSFQESGGISP
jgi:hypothetical protein